MIELKEITYSIGSFDLDVSFEVGDAEYCVLFGMTGCGKTSLLECVCGLRPQQTGRIILNEREISRLPPRDRNIGYVPQDGALFEHLTVRGNIEFALKVRGIPRAERRRITDRTARDMRIHHLLERTVPGLSGGERQRTALARALVTRPQLLLLDEPVSALDEHTRDAICRELKRINREQQIPVIHVCHSFEEARMVADRIAIMRNGRIILAGNPGQLVNNPRSRYVAEILRLDNILNGHIIHEGGQTFFESNSCRFGTSDDAPPGPATVLIKSWQIVPAGPAVKCDNMVSGRILEISQVPPLARITLETPIHLTALVPLGSPQLAGLKPGDKTTLAFNAEALQLLKRH